MLTLTTAKELSAIVRRVPGDTPILVFAITATDIIDRIDDLNVFGDQQIPDFTAADIRKAMESTLAALRMDNEDARLEERIIDAIPGSPTKYHA